MSRRSSVFPCLYAERGSGKKYEPVTCQHPEAGLHFGDPYPNVQEGSEEGLWLCRPAMSGIWEVTVCAAMMSNEGEK